MTDNQTKDLILVTGATGYIGGRLVPELLKAGYRVRVMSRRPMQLEDRDWSGDVEIVVADAFKPDTLLNALKDVDAAYYLIHSMHGGDDFHERDLKAAHNFAQSASEAQVERIIYLGGLGSPDATDKELSEHLKSRQEVGRALASYDVDVTEFRAAVIIGSGSISFEMLRYLTERLPVMISPKWVDTRIQPIAIDDAIQYLVSALSVSESRNHIIEIGGETVQSYRDMMLGYAEARDLQRTIFPVPVLTPRLSSYWVHLVTPIPSSIARPLIDGLRNEVIVTNDTAQTLFPDIRPIGYQAAVNRALSNLRASEIETTWSDSQSSVYGFLEAYEFQEEQGMMIERRQREVDATEEEIFAAITRIGGSSGWLYLDWLWRLRGILDRFMGGPGYRGGRRHPQHLRVGDTLDFWRVESLKKNEYLMLRAEMKLPGRGWLEFEITPQDNGKVCVAETAYYAPKGFWGLAYWYAMFIPHKFIFDGMIDALIAEAESMDDPDTTAPSQRNPLPLIGGITAVFVIAAALIFNIINQRD